MERPDIDRQPARAGRPVSRAPRQAQSALAAVLALCLAGGLAGCASTPHPAGEIATARAALDGARREGAPQHAANTLGEAEDRLARAERAAAARDNESARRLAEEARITAEVAAESARLAKARTAIEALQRSGAVPAPAAPLSAPASGTPATVVPVESSTVVPVAPPGPAPAAGQDGTPASPGAAVIAPGAPAPAAPVPAPR